MYKLILNGSTISKVGTQISFLQDPDNTDYQEYLAWLAEGNEPLPPEEPQKTWDEIRSERNQLLNQSDWTQTPDSPLNQSARLAERALWREYRQALRDITTTYSDPNDVVFPNPPA